MKSNEQKKVQGTLQKCRIKNPPTYQPLTTIPDPAFKVDPNGLQYFWDFCQVLLDNKLLNASYVPIITRAAYWFSIYHQAVSRVTKEGLTQTAKTGWEQKSAWFTVMSDAEDRITKIEEKFGMTLVSNLKLNIPKPEKENPFDDL